MNLNATIIAQMIIVAIVFWVATKLWPFLTEAIEQRNKRIAEGLAAAERGQKELASAEARVEELVKDARARALAIEQQAHAQANQIIESARQTASSEGARLVAAAKEQVALDSQKARDELRRQVAGLAVAGASQLIQREISATAHADLLDKLAAQL